MFTSLPKPIHRVEYSAFADRIVSSEQQHCNRKLHYLKCLDTAAFYNKIIY